MQLSIETHRTVLNQILRQTNSTLAEGPFAVLVNHTRLLDFDIKRRHFRQELDKQDKVRHRFYVIYKARKDRLVKCKTNADLEMQLQLVQLNHCDGVLKNNIAEIPYKATKYLTIQ